MVSQNDAHDTTIQLEAAHETMIQAEAVQEATIQPEAAHEITIQPEVHAQTIQGETTHATTIQAEAVQEATIESEPAQETPIQPATSKESTIQPEEAEQMTIQSEIAHEAEIQPGATDLAGTRGSRHPEVDEVVRLPETDITEDLDAEAPHDETLTPPSIHTPHTDQDILEITDLILVHMPVREDHEIIEIFEPTPAPVPVPTPILSPAPIPVPTPIPVPPPHFLLIYIAVITVQIINAGLPIMAKRGINKGGLNSYIFTLYRNIIGAPILTALAMLTSDRTVAVEHVSWIVLGLIVLLGLLEPIFNQNLIYSGLKHTTSGFSQLVSMMQPAIIFIVACLFRMETLHYNRLSGKAKIFSVVLVGTAAIVALSSWDKTISFYSSTTTKSQIFYDSEGASIRSVIGLCVSTCYTLILGKTLERFPAPIALSAGVVVVGAVGNLIMALTIHKLDIHKYMSESYDFIAAILYAGVLASVGSVLNAYVVRSRGPVFSAAFNPLSLILGMLVALIGAKQPLLLSSVIAVALVSVGLSILVWGKYREQKEAEAAAPQN